MASRLPLSRRSLLRGALSVAAGGGLAAWLAACGGTPPPAPAPPTVAATLPPATAPATAGDTRLVAWFTDRRSINVMTEQEAIPEYQRAHPGVSVEVVFVPEAQIPQKLTAAKAANNAPDVAAIDETFLDQLWKGQALRPIPPSLLNVRQEMGARVADLYRLPPGASQGDYHALPNGQFGGVLYYNLDLLNELKYTPEQIPDTWEEFIRWARDVTIWEGSTLKRAGFAIFDAEDSLRTEYRVQKGGWDDGNQFETKDTVNLTRDLEYEAITWLLDLYEVHRVDARDGVNYQTRFGSGQAVTTFTWTWNNGFFETQYKLMNYGIKLAPHVAPGSGGPLGASGPDVGFCTTVQSTEPGRIEAAWTLWRWLVGPDYLKRYCTLRGVQPSLKSMWNLPEFSAEKGDPKWAALATKMQPGNHLDSGFNSIELSTILWRAWTRIREGKEDPRVVLPDTERQANDHLKANPQWSILSARDYRDHPDWIKAAG